MATPNIVNVTSINGALIAGSVTGSPVGIIDVPDNKLYKIIDDYENENLSWLISKGLSLNIIEGELSLSI